MLPSDGYHLGYEYVELLGYEYTTCAVLRGYLSGMLPTFDRNLLENKSD